MNRAFKPSSRRDFLKIGTGLVVGWHGFMGYGALGHGAPGHGAFEPGVPVLEPSGHLSWSNQPEFDLRYIVASSMYGYTDVDEILGQVHAAGAQAIDLWPMVHGNQREQLDEMGEDAFAELLDQHDVQLGCITQYKLGPFGLTTEMQLAERFGCHTIVTGAVGPRGLEGTELRAAVSEFVERLKPHLEVAEEHDVTIAIENHGNNLIDSSDAIRILYELRPSNHLAIALAPYHLPQLSEDLAQLIRDVGDGIEMFYAWQHGMGCMTKLPKEQELLQLPGRGDLDFQPIMSALQAVDYSGWTEIFMHPVPRGEPILAETGLITDEINRSRGYIESFLVE